MGRERVTDPWKGNLACRLSPPQRQERGLQNGCYCPRAQSTETDPAGEAKSHTCRCVRQSKGQVVLPLQQIYKDKGVMRERESEEKAEGGNGDE